MNFIDLSIKKPVVVIVGVMLILMFGFVALGQLPYQLTPNVVQPEISVQTVWPGATPNDVERDIIEKQEEHLKGTPGLMAYKSTSSDNVGEITLTFKVGTDMNKALLEVSNKLNQVETYPVNVERPIISSSGANASPVIWMGFVADEGNSEDIDIYKSYLDDEIKEHIERIEGVSGLFQRGGTKVQMQVLLHPERLAAYNLTIDRVASVIQRENMDTSAGTVDIDRRTYRIRTTARFTDEQQLKNVVLFSDGQRRITLGDVAEVRKGYHKRDTTIFASSAKGIDKALVYGVRPELGANIVDLTNRVEAAVKRLNSEVLPEKKIHIEWFYDQRSYINGAIELVKQNILVGGILAVIVLLLFLRSLSATAVVGLAIPISIISTFIVLNIMERSLNTISLAGISFAVGMLLDSAIVVLENIDRHRKMGKRFFKAAHDGSMEVWGALIASALTTIAVFVPVIFLENEAGQLFKDIAIAVTTAITFSLFVSISVIPMFWTQLMRLTSKEERLSDDELRLRHQQATPPAGMAARLGTMMMGVVAWSIKTPLHQFAMVVTMGVASVLTVVLLFPKMEYLPQGNQNLLMNILIPPPGLSYEEKRHIGQSIYSQLQPHFGQEKDGFPGINRMFYVASGDFIIAGALGEDEQRARELIPLMIPVVNSFPGVFGISLQRGVFEQGIGEGRSIDVNIIGEDIEALANVGGMLFGAISRKIPGSQIRPVPSIELLFPEARLTPDRNRLAAVGLDSTGFGFAADVLLDGRKISEYAQEGKKSIDLILKSYGESIETPEALYMTQVATPKAGLVSISELASLEHTTGITQIRHVGGKRTITLQVTPPMTMTLEEAMERLSGEIERLSGGSMLKGAEVKLAGQADKLTQTVNSMKWNLLFALAIIYLLMSALFGNFIYPLVIMFTVPLATAGGFIGLALTDRYVEAQPLDVLTMLGFIILIGIVVNNAILIVHQALNNIRYNALAHKEAILEATRSRLRPIFMSSLTSIFGMLPLVLVPGPGSEFYRGLGSVITGGLALSTIFTIFVTPALLYFVIKAERFRKKEGA